MAQPPPLDGVHEMAEEGVSPHLAVGDHVQPDVGLKGDGLVDGPALDPLEPGVGDLPGLEPLPGLFQIIRPQQAPNDIASELDHSGLSFRNLRHRGRGLPENRGALSANPLTIAVFKGKIEIHRPTPRGNAGDPQAGPANRRPMDFQTAVRLRINWGRVRG